MPEQSNDYRVVVFGAGGVGKSSLVLRFIRNSFSENYVPTVEDTYRQVMTCTRNIFTLEITDTTGSYAFPAMQRLSTSKGHAFVLVYAITSRQSFEELAPIHAFIRDVKGSLEGVPLMLVGNKCDEEALRKVPREEGEKRAQSWCCNFMETSARDNTNVKEMFQELLNMEKSRNVSLQAEGRTLFRKYKIKAMCAVM